VEEDRQIPVRDGSSITVRIHKPKVLPEDGCPIFVVYHGGGFVLGGLDDEAILCRNFTQLGGIAVNVDYRLAPEHPFPVPIEDAFDALKWVCNRRFPPELG
jgi:acetyl esterase/lipase